MGELELFMNSIFWEKWRPLFNKQKDLWFQDKSINHQLFFKSNIQYITEQEELNPSDPTDDAVLLKNFHNVRSISIDFIIIRIYRRNLHMEELNSIHELLCDESYVNHVHSKFTKLGFSPTEIEFILWNTRRLTSEDNIARAEHMHRENRLKEYNILTVELNTFTSKEYTDCIEQAEKILLLSIIKHLITEKKIFKNNEEDIRTRETVKLIAHVNFMKMKFTHPNVW